MRITFRCSTWSISREDLRTLLLLFFFSSRRRHTRYWRDWSSDVCSSDLIVQIPRPYVSVFFLIFSAITIFLVAALNGVKSQITDPTLVLRHDYVTLPNGQKIGRASCRERV